MLGKFPEYCVIVSDGTIFSSTTCTSYIIWSDKIFYKAAIFSLFHIKPY